MKITTPDAAVEVAGLPLEATVAMADVAGAMREGLLAFSAAAGLVVMQQMLTEELTSIVGQKHAKLVDRVGNWHGTTTGQVVLGSQKVAVARPRGRYVDGGEVELATWETFASEDLLRQVVVERMLAGVATRRHVDVTDPVGVAGKATSKSAVSRRFKAATEKAMSDLLARDLTGLETAVLMIDGLNVADQMITVALVITADGTKVPVGLMLGDTENAVVVTDLLADLVARGLRFEHGILAVLDGSKALRKAVVKVFGERALIQRCTLHKRRNVIGYLPVDERDAVDRRLAIAFAQIDPAKGLKACRDLARQLDGPHPDAAASLREGLEDMFTVAGLGVTGRLRQSLTNTNCVESMISICRTTTGRVKHWRTGTMKKRWIAAGMLEAERSFRRLKGYADMPVVVNAITAATNPTVTPANYAQVA
ncbi:MAG: transposase [Geodermatophilaceae bacterium]|nr:transposase [Geodermatophilaceae bacterium]